MLSDKEMLDIAERYLGKRRGKSSIEPMIYENEIIKKSYGSIYFYDSKEYILTGNFNKSLARATAARPKLQAASHKLQASSSKLDKKAV